MGRKETLGLVLLCAGLGAWVWWDVRQKHDPNLAFPLLRVSPEEISRIEIERGVSRPGASPGRERIVLQKDGLTWHILEPLWDLAEPTAVTETADKPCSSWPVAYLDPPVDAARYGIGAESLRVTLTHPNGQASFRVGLGFEAQQKFYVQVEGEARVAVLPEDIAQPYLKPVDKYRRAKALDLKADEVARIARQRFSAGRSESDATRLEFERDEGIAQGWKVHVAGSTVDADSKLVSEMLEWVSRVTLRKFLAPSAGQPLDHPPGPLREAFEFEFFVRNSPDPVRVVLALPQEKAAEGVLIFMPERKTWGLGSVVYPEWAARPPENWRAQAP